MAFLQDLLKNSAKNHLDDNILGKPRMCGKRSPNWLIIRSVVEEGPKSTAVELKPQALGKVYPQIVILKQKLLPRGHPSPLFRTWEYVVLLLNSVCFLFFMQPAYLVACCFETQLVTKSLKWQKRRRLKNSFTSSSLTPSLSLSSRILLEAASYSPTCFSSRAALRGHEPTGKPEWQLPVSWAQTALSTMTITLSAAASCEDTEGKPTTIKLTCSVQL